MNAKYRKWCAGQQNLPLFAQDWWMDAVCGRENWFVHQNLSGAHAFAMPLYEVKLKGIRRIVQPPWSQYSSISSLDNLFSDIHNPYRRNKLLKEFLLTFPAFPMVELNLGPQFQEGLAFNWAGFQLQTRYTFIIPTERKENLKSGYSKNLKRNLTSATKSYQVEVSTDANLLFQLIRQTLLRKKAGIVPDQHVVVRLLEALLKHGRGQFLIAKDQNKVVGGVCIAWDDKYTYYIIGGQESLKGKPSPHSILMHKAIEESLEKGRHFDFCGSMMPGVARFFSSFGPETHSFLQVSKYSGRGRIKKFKLAIT